MTVDSTGKSCVLSTRSFVLLSLFGLLCLSASPARSQQPTAQNAEGSVARSPAPATTSAIPAQSDPQAGPQAAQPSNPQASATITGKVIDQSGTTILGAKVALSRGDQSISQEVLTNEDGLFAFTGLPPGPFHVTISSPGLTPQSFDDTLQPGQTYKFPLVMMTVATQVTEVHVTLTQEEIATQEVKEEEKQRVLGFIPNYFVTFAPSAQPLPHKLKFHMAWKSASDPFTLGAVGALAGFEQATNKYKDYGQGFKGYSKRYGANYANVAAGTFISNAILPSLFKQDPRYFYRGTGSTRSRILYALRSAFVSRSDSGRWEPNYSDIIGSAATGGIANLYYPRRNRGGGLLLSVMFTRIGEITAASLFDEFLGPKFTSHVASQSSPSDQP